MGSFIDSLSHIAKILAGYFGNVSVFLVGIFAAGYPVVGVGYLLGTILHGTGMAPSQLMAKQFGMDAESSIKLLVLPFIALLCCLWISTTDAVKALLLDWKTESWMSTRHAQAGIAHAAFAISMSMMACVIVAGVSCVVLGYLAGAHFADDSSSTAWFARLLCVAPPITLVSSLMGASVIVVAGKAS